MQLQLCVRAMRLACPTKLTMAILHRVISMCFRQHQNWHSQLLFPVVRLCTESNEGERNQITQQSGVGLQNHVKIRIAHSKA